MPIVQQGSINTTALVVPDLYVQIVPPQNLILNGVPTNVLGMVGTASWGPLGQPVIIGTMAEYASAFGPVMARKYDMGTHVATAVQQGAQNFRCVRVSDGTDSAAQATIPGTSATATALYTGALGNQIALVLGPAAKPGLWRLTVSLPGLQPEVYDNLGGSGADFWNGLAAAVNQGQGPQRGASQLIVFSAGGTTTAATPFSLTLGTGSPGTDGAAGVSAAQLVGSDTAPRSGMYALRGQGCGIALLADADDSTQWTTQAGFGLQEGIYMILTGPAGDTIQNAVAVKTQAGLDSYAAKLMFGDWLWWSDQVNNTIRLVSPQGFVAGRLANLSPEQSSLNKPLYGVVGSQKTGAPGSGQSTSYSSADLAALLGVGIDLVSNPQPGGAYWGVRGGHNSSSDPAVDGDNYTRLTNFIAATLAAGMGTYVGQVINADLFRRIRATIAATLAAGMGTYVGQVINADLFRRIRATLLSFLQNMLGQGLLGSSDGSLPYSVVCDASNNPGSRTGLGYVQADVQVQYQGINEKFLVNDELGIATDRKGGRCHAWRSIGPAGRVDLTHVASFEARQITQSVRVDRLDGVPMGTELPKGWEGSFEVERGSSSLEDLIALVEQQYFSGSGVSFGTMYQYISETDGSTSTYQYDTVTFKLTSAGQWRGDNSVKQKLEFFAARRRRI